MAPSGRSEWLLGLVSDRNAIYQKSTHNLIKYKVTATFYVDIYCCTSSACFSAKFGCWKSFPIDGVKSAEENSLDDVSDVGDGV